MSFLLLLLTILLMLKDRGDSQAAVYGPEMTIAYGPYDMETLGKNYQKTRTKK